MPPLLPFIIDAPFGNYFSWPEATSVLGTFTWARRGGVLRRLWRVLRTVRYYPSMDAWRNKLGLPNPGIEWLLSGYNINRTAGCLVSVKSWSTGEWSSLVYRVAHECAQAGLRGVVLNLSCPNCPGEEDKSDYEEVFERARHYTSADNVGLYVKLPPVGYEQYMQLGLKYAVDGFHCCNTLPTPAGGLSGKPLKQLSLACIQRVREASANAPRCPRIIGGGGIRDWSDIEDYRRAGAEHFAVASGLFFPKRWDGYRRLAVRLLLPGVWDDETRGMPTEQGAGNRFVSISEVKMREESFIRKVLPIVLPTDTN